MGKMIQTLEPLGKKLDLSYEQAIEILKSFKPLDEDTIRSKLDFICEIYDENSCKLLVTELWDENNLSDEEEVRDWTEEVRDTLNNKIVCNLENTGMKDIMIMAYDSDSNELTLTMKAWPTNRVNDLQHIQRR